MREGLEISYWKDDGKREKANPGKACPNRKNAQLSVCFSQFIIFPLHTTYLH